MVIQMVFGMMMVRIMNNFVVYNLQKWKNNEILIDVISIGFTLFTFGFDNLKTTTAAETTNDNRPSVSAFHAFSAINAKANGNKTVVLNFKPSKNGINTFLTRPRPTYGIENE